MDRNHCADMSFHIHPCAHAVGTLLAYREPDFAVWDEKAGYLAWFETKPWYNGRERGLCFIMQPERVPGARAIFLAVFEHRCSDDIVVEEWIENGLPLNEVSLASREAALGSKAADAVYRARKTFPNGAIGKVADHLYNRMASFYKGAQKLAKDKETPCAANSTP